MQQMTKTQNTAFLKKCNLHLSTLDVEKDDSIEGYKAYFSIVDERFKEYGLGKSLQKQMDLSLQLIHQYNRLVQTGDRFIMNTINILQAELEALKKENKSEEEEDTSFHDELGILFEKYGAFDIKTTSIYNYETMKKGLINSYKREKANATN